MTIRIAMWSGPRNISTAMMRAFENRADTAVWDEPFYAAYLKETGLDHPMRDEILRHHETDWREVAAATIGPVPDGAAVFYQKHMTHHMIDEIGRGWMDHEDMRHAFLIRDPESVIASYAAKREVVTLDDIGFRQQSELFDRVADTLGKAPPVVDSRDVLADPEAMLGKLCEHLEIVFDPAMLTWPAGQRSSDGVWASHWYHAVETSTGFAAARAPVGFDELDDAHKPVAQAARSHYERLAAWKIR
jgi:Sulfotransferase domain